jgi:competence protein ComFC
MRSWEKWVQAAAALLYPPECALCRKPMESVGVLCSSCCASLVEIGEPRCARCGDRLDDPRADLCFRCGTETRFVDRLVAVGMYDDGWGDLIRVFKFQRERALGRWLAEKATACFQRRVPVEDIDVVTFVPMTRREKRHRGFNPSRILAAAVARRIGRPMQTTLRKTRQTPPQATLSRRDREHNLRGAFRAVRSHSQRVLLVDDICTTGSTAEECARALKESGCPAVVVLTVARA